jgi:hypothetical protein
MAYTVRSHSAYRNEVILQLKKCFCRDKYFGCVTEHQITGGRITKWQKTERPITKGRITEQQQTEG